jgi:hypothetical protein
MKVMAIKCPHCENIIFSRAQHDFRECPCGKVFIDGGQEYTRYGHDNDIQQVEMMEIEVKQTKQELYNDWNTSTDSYGIIK